MQDDQHAAGCRPRDHHHGSLSSTLPLLFFMLPGRIQQSKVIWVWLLFGNEQGRKKSGDFEHWRGDDDGKLPGYRGERGISPGLGTDFWCFFSRE